MPRLQNQRGDNSARDEAGGAVLRLPGQWTLKLKVDHLFSQRDCNPSGRFQAGKNKPQKFKQKIFSGSSDFRLHEPTQFYKVSCFSTRQS